MTRGRLPVSNQMRVKLDSVALTRIATLAMPLGTPCGIGVLMDAATALIPVPPPSEAQMTEQLERAVHDALAAGLTSVHDAAVSSRMLAVFKKSVPHL